MVTLSTPDAGLPEDLAPGRTLEILPRSPRSRRPGWKTPVVNLCVARQGGSCRPGDHGEDGGRDPRIGDEAAGVTDPQGLTSYPGWGVPQRPQNREVDHSAEASAP